MTQTSSAAAQFGDGFLLIFNVDVFLDAEKTRDADSGVGNQLHRRHLFGAAALKTPVEIAGKKARLEDLPQSVEDASQDLGLVSQEDGEEDDAGGGHEGDFAADAGLLPAQVIVVPEEAGVAAVAAAARHRLVEQGHELAIGGDVHAQLVTRLVGHVVVVDVLDALA